MKAYISIPISGRPLHEAKYQAECIKAKLTEHGHECITPFDVCPESGAEIYGKHIVYQSSFYFLDFTTLQQSQ